jgi:short-subunit dehydrogenase
MAKRKCGQIVNVISMAALFPVPVRTIYSASKYATRVFSASVRAEVKDLNISVTDIYPGYVQTDISKNALVGDGSAFGKLDDNM